MAILTCKVNLRQTKHRFAGADLDTVPAILKLRNDPRLLKLPPYISLLCMLGGVVWVLLLPLNQYSRQTYISENALLPGQVHTYFGGSEQNVFRAYKQELLSVIQPYNEAVSTIEAQPLRARNRTANELRLSEEVDRRSDKIEELFQNAGLKTSRQKYAYESSGEKYWGENVYSVLNAPRGDGTEAIVLVAALKNIEGKDNVNGVALLVTLARYFKRILPLSNPVYRPVELTRYRVVSMVEGHDLSRHARLHCRPPSMGRRLPLYP